MATAFAHDQFALQQARQTAQASRHVELRTQHLADHTDHTDHIDHMSMHSRVHDGDASLQQFLLVLQEAPQLSTVLRISSAHDPQASALPFLFTRGMQSGRAVKAWVGASPQRPAAAALALWPGPCSSRRRGSQSP